MTFTPADTGTPQRLKLDKKHPPRFTVGNLLLEVTTLNGENALRIRDTFFSKEAKFMFLQYCSLVN